MEHDLADPLRARRRTLITGAGGQLGRALATAFAGDEVLALDRRAWDVCDEPPHLPWTPDLVLHTAAWTNVDGAEDDPQGAAAANVAGTAHAASIGDFVVRRADGGGRAGPNSMAETINLTGGPLGGNGSTESGNGGPLL